jgi:hypothetical protein
MDRFMNAVTAYPTAILSVLLVVLLAYWMLALLGWVDFESVGGDLNVEVQADADPGELPVLAGYLVALGLNGVPFSVVISALVLVAWTVSALAGEWLMPLIPTTLLYVLVGTVVLVFSLAIALPITAVLVRPLRGLFVTHQAIGNASIVGQTCVVMSMRVDSRVGYASVAQRGTHLQIRVIAAEGNQLTKGSVARILEYDLDGNRYWIEAEP